MSLRVIDRAAWARASTFAFYQGFADPTFELAVEVELGDLPDRARASGASLFAATLYALGVAVHAVDGFRLRIRGEQVVLHDVVHPGFVALGADEQLRFCGVRWSADWPTFAAAVRDGSAAAAAEPGVREAHPSDDAFFVSAMPWLVVRSARHARSGGAGDCVPKFTWGKVRPGAPLVLCLSAHHGLVDGADVRRLVDAMQVAAERWRDA